MKTYCITFTVSGTKQYNSDDVWNIFNDIGIDYNSPDETVVIINLDNSQLNSIRKNLKVLKALIERDKGELVSYFFEIYPNSIERFV